MSIARELKSAIRQAQRGYPEEARALCGAVLRRAPQSAEVHHLMGLFCKDSGDLPAAEHHLRRALELGGSQPPFLAALAGVLALSGQHEAAVTIYQQVLSAAPGDLRARADLALTWLRMGRPERAIEAWREVVCRAPADPGARFGLGAALLEAGCYSEAAGCFEGVLELQPTHMESLNNLATAQAAMGDPAAAERTLRRALALSPGDARLHANLGAALAAQGRVEAPIACYERALSLHPGYQSAAVKLGNHLVESGRYQQAVPYFERVLVRDPEAVEAAAGLVNALERQGEVERAVAVLERVQHLAPRSVNLVAAAATLWLRSAPARAAVLVEACLSRPLTVAQRALLLQHLGHLRDALGEHHRAFEAWREANATRELRLDTEAWWAEVRGVLAAFPSGRALPQAADRCELPVLIVGVPRSGTSLVEQILSCHPEVHGAGELELLRVMTERARARTGLAWPEQAAALDRETLEALGGEYLAAVRALAGPGIRRVTDKMPQNFRWLGLAGMALPGARVIHCRREPREVALSCFRQNFSAGYGWSQTLEDIAAYYRGQELLMEHWRKVCPLPIFELDYERLVTAPEEVIPELVAFCGLGWDERCLRPHENRRAVNTASYAQVRRPIYTSSVERSAPYREQLRPFEEALAALRAERIPGGAQEVTAGPEIDTPLYSSGASS